MSIVLNLAMAAAYFAIGGLAAYRVHKLLPYPLVQLRGRFPTTIFDRSMRLFLLSVVFLVATAPVLLLAYAISGAP